jgi:hypothetical protein
MFWLKPRAPAYPIYLPNQGSKASCGIGKSIDFAPATLMSTGSIAYPLLPEIQQPGESLGETHRPAGVRSARGVAHRADLGRGMELPCRVVEFGRRARHGRALKEKAEPKKKDVGFGQMPKGPLQIVVSIGNQKVTLFSNGVRVAQGPVSTGVPGRLPPRPPTSRPSAADRSRYS